MGRRHENVFLMMRSTDTWRNRREVDRKARKPYWAGYGRWSWFRRRRSARRGSRHYHHLLTMRAAYLLSQEVILHRHEVSAISALKSDSRHENTIVGSRVGQTLLSGQTGVSGPPDYRLLITDSRSKASTNRPLPGWQVRWQPNQFEKGQWPAKALACAFAILPGLFPQQGFGAERSH